MVDEDYTIIYGHGRVQACQYNAQNGVESDFVKDWNKCPVIICDWLTEEQKRKYRLLDNKLNESEWDFDLLNTELPDLDFSDFDIDWGILDKEEETAEVIEDDYEVEPPEEPKSKYGDIYQLGRHRLMCGDSTKQEDVEKLMNGEEADMVFTDPPYGMKKENYGVANDNLNYDDLLEFNKKWIPLTFKFTKDNGSWYCWGIDEPLMDIYSEILKPMIKENKITFRNLITWKKENDNPTMLFNGACSSNNRSFYTNEKCLFVMIGVQGFNNNSDNYFEGFEPIRKYLNQEAAKVGLDSAKLKEICGVGMYSHWFTKSQWTLITKEHYEKLQSYYKYDVFKKEYEEIKKEYEEIKKEYEEIKKEWYLTRAYFYGKSSQCIDVWVHDVTSQKERKIAGGHATPKPVELCARAIKTSSREEETVLDVFGGSGSTLIACEETNRKCYVMELEPKWIDVIINRWEQFTGEKAVLINE